MWGAIELDKIGWDASSIYLKFVCIGAAFVLLNIIVTSIFYCIVWRLSIKRESEKESIELSLPIARYGISPSERVSITSNGGESSDGNITGLWGSSESVSEKEPVVAETPKNPEIKYRYTAPEIRVQRPTRGFKKAHLKGKFRPGTPMPSDSESSE